MTYTLLLIDDDEDIRLILTSVLASIDGLTILQAENGAEAKSLLQNNLVNGVLLDYQLPDISGEELLQELRADPSTGAPDIIMLSARDEESLVEGWISLGAKAVFKKPFNPFELLAQLQVHFDF